MRQGSAIRASVIHGTGCKESHFRRQRLPAVVRLLNSPCGHSVNTPESSFRPIPPRRRATVGESRRLTRTCQEIFVNLSRIRTATIALATIAVAASATQSASARTLPPHTPKTWEVKMITQDGKQLFEPADLKIQSGDTIRWLAVSGSHNVGFWIDSVPKGAVDLLRKAMPDTIEPLLGKRIPTKGDSYVVTFGNMPKGLYRYYCKPHLKKGMVGTVTIQ
jgi:plastocyanin